LHLEAIFDEAVGKGRENVFSLKGGIYHSTAPDVNRPRMNVEWPNSSLNRAPKQVLLLLYLQNNS